MSILGLNKESFTSSKPLSQPNFRSVTSILESCPCDDKSRDTLDFIHLCWVPSALLFYFSELKFELNIGMLGCVFAVRSHEFIIHLAS